MPESTHEDSLISLDQSARGFREWVAFKQDKLGEEPSCGARWGICIDTSSDHRAICLFSASTKSPAALFSFTASAAAIEQAADEPKARMGRPSFDWDSFHVEIAMRIYSGNGLPAKQEALIADMQASMRRPAR
jgi:hypothetical protein